MIASIYVQYSIILDSEFDKFSTLIDSHPVPYSLSGIINATSFTIGAKTEIILSQNK